VARAFALGGLGFFGGDSLTRIFMLDNGPAHPDLKAEQLEDLISGDADFSTSVASPTFAGQASTIDFYYHVVNRDTAPHDVTVEVSLDGALVSETVESFPLGGSRSVYRALTGRAESDISVRILNPDMADIQVLVGASAIAPGGGGGPEFIRGDHDVSGQVDITDSLNLLGFLFIGTNPPLCADASDGDNSGNLDISDALNVLTFLFLGTVQIPTPGHETCGPDPVEAIPPGQFAGLPGQPAAVDENGAPFGLGPLGCESYSACAAP